MAVISIAFNISEYLNLAGLVSLLREIAERCCRNDIAVGAFLVI